MPSYSNRFRVSIPPSGRYARTITQIGFAGVCAMLVDMRVSEFLVVSSEHALTCYCLSLIGVSARPCDVNWRKRECT